MKLRVRDPFILLACEGMGEPAPKLKPPKKMWSATDPPSDRHQCWHVEIYEIPDGELTKMTYRRCVHRSHFGFLCRLHDTELLTPVPRPVRGDQDGELAERIRREVQNARMNPDDEPAIIDYVTYRHWGWATQIAPFEEFEGRGHWSDKLED